MFSGRLIDYLKTNWGAPFVTAFVVLLVASAAELSSGATDSANGIAIYGFYSLVVGVALQIASYARYGEAGTSSPRIEAPQTTAAPHSKGLPRNTKVAAVAAAALILLAGVVVGYPMLSHPGAPAGGASTSTSSSGCAGPKTGGTVYISTNATVTIEICGQSFLVNAGSGGGLTYAYPAGRVSFSAPGSVNGSAFEFWYAIVGSSPAQRVSNATLTLNLPAGLVSQSSLIELYYAAPPTPVRSSTVIANSSTSTSTSTSATTNSSSSSTSSASSSSTSTNSSTTSTTSSTSTATFCMGSDGSVFVSTNVETAVPIDICGEQVQVLGGTGGGLDFGYRAGNVTLVAPATADGKAFEYWFVVLPSHQEQVLTNQLTIYLPAGLAPGNSIVEAFYG